MSEQKEAFFSEDYIPPEIICRESQMEKLLEKPAYGMYCEGDKSTGKTVTALKYAETLRKGNQTVLYFSSKRPIMMDFAEAVEKLLTRRLKFGEYALHVFFETSEKRVTVIWDDIHQVIKFVSFNNFCHDLYEHAKEYHKKLHLILIGTMKYPKFSTYIRDDVQSRYQFYPIIFPTYDALEVARILKTRLSLAEIEYDEEAVAFISAKIRRLAGDLRLAFQIIKKAIPRLNHNLTLELVQQAWDIVKTDYWIDQIKAMDQHTQLLLYAATRLAAEKGEQITTLDINNTYRQICYNNNIDPIYSQRTNYFLSKLEKDNWFTRVGAISKGRAGRAMILRYEMTPETVEKSFEQLLPEILTTSAPYDRQKTLTSQEKIE